MVNPTAPILGQLTKINSKPVRWRWTINGQDVELTTRQLQTYRLLRDKCFRHSLRYDPHFMRGTSWPKLSSEQWRQHVQTAFASLIESDS
jgi:hypothetical protein